MIYMTDKYLADAALFHEPATHSRILWDNLLRDAEFWANTAKEGFAAVRARSADTVSWWWPAGAGVLIATMPEAREIDGVAIAGHTIGSSGESVIVSVRIDGVWEIAHPEITPVNDEPIIVGFEKVAATGVRITLSGSARIAVIYAGSMLEMARPAYNDLPPLALIRNTSFDTNKSETGQFMGRSITSTSRPFEASWSHLPNDWTRQIFMRFALVARTAPFFIALRPEGYPDDVGYVLASADINPERMGVLSYLSVQIKGEAHMEPTL